MRPQAFQYGEIRDENDNIIRPGAYGKNTAFTNVRNDGILDYIMNNFDVAWDEIQYVKEQEGKDLSDYYTKEETDALIPTRLSTLTNDTGFITVAATVNGAVKDGAGNDIVTTYAKLNSPALTGTPTAPTPATTDNSTKIATTSYVKTLFSSVSDGEDGGYYIPHIDSSNNLTWTASKDTMPVISSSVNIRGATGATGATGGYYTPSVDENGILSWTPSAQYMPRVESAMVKGNTGATGATGAAGQDGADGGYYIPDIDDNILTFSKSKDTMPDSLISVNVKGDTGEDGVGIEDVDMNEDYTITFTYTNGDTYTTASVRGEKGEKGDTVSVENLTNAEIDDIWNNN